MVTHLLLAQGSAKVTVASAPPTPPRNYVLYLISTI